VIDRSFFRSRPPTIIFSTSRMCLLSVHNRPSNSYRFNSRKQVIVVPKSKIGREFGVFFRVLWGNNDVVEEWRRQQSTSRGVIPSIGSAQNLLKCSGFSELQPFLFLFQNDRLIKGQKRPGSGIRDPVLLRPRPQTPDLQAPTPQQDFIRVQAE
jgi:hypothetical protein